MADYYPIPDFGKGRNQPTDDMSLRLNRSFLTAARAESLAKPDWRSSQNNGPVASLQDGMRVSRRTANPRAGSK